MLLLDVWKVLEDPAWLSFGIMVAVGGGALAALFFLYPFGRD
jgi:hypothetical protein